VRSSNIEGRLIHTLEPATLNFSNEFGVRTAVGSSDRCFKHCQLSRRSINYAGASTSEWKHMRLNHIGEDIEATAVMPQLDLHVMAAALERIEHASIDAVASTPNTSAEWKFADQLAELQDQIATLQAAIRESENRYSRLAIRHTSLLQKFEEREAAQLNTRSALNQAHNKVMTLEQQLLQMSADTAEMRQVAAASIQQCRQRELFILKQASEIKRLRDLQP
jgi:chromosome segregation ATPase